MSKIRRDDDLTGDHLRYLELHAGLAILWSARAHVRLRPFDSAMTVTFLAEKSAEIEREIDEMKR